MTHSRVKLFARVYLATALAFLPVSFGYPAYALYCESSTSDEDLNYSPISCIYGTASEGQLLSLTAPEGYIISGVYFASYGTPEDYNYSTCHAEVSREVVDSYIQQGNFSNIPAVNDIFGDPCSGTVKRLSVVLTIEPQEKPAPEIVPAPAPDPEPELTLEPQPEPGPQPAPELKPEPTASPSVPTIDPTLSPEPEPFPQETPTQSPAPQPQPEPQPTFVPEPEPEPQPEPTPSPSPSPSPVPSLTPETTPTLPPLPIPSTTQLPTPVQLVPVPPTPEPVIPFQPPVLQPTEPPTPPVVPEVVAEPVTIREEVELLLDPSVDPTELTVAQVEQVLAIAYEIFATAEQGSPEYEQALDLLSLIAKADDPQISEELAAIPLVGVAAAQVLEVFNNLGNLGSDMSPAVREQSEDVVVTAVVVTAVAQAAAAAAASASASAVGGSGSRTIRKVK